MLAGPTGIRGPVFLMRTRATTSARSPPGVRHPDHRVVRRRAGSPDGHLGGLTLLFVIENLIVQGTNLNSYVQQVVSGAFLLVVVILQAVVSRRTGWSDV